MSVQEGQTRAVLFFLSFFSKIIVGGDIALEPFWLGCFLKVQPWV